MSSAPAEDPAVPEVAALGQVALGGGCVGLLDESFDDPRAGVTGELVDGTQVAIAGRGSAGRDTEGDEMSLVGHGGRFEQ